MLFLSFLLCFRARPFIDAVWPPAGKGLTSWLSFVMCNCVVVNFHFDVLGQVWCLIVSIPDSCPLSYYNKYSLESGIGSLSLLF